MVQRNSIEKKSRLTKRKIVVAIIVVAISFFVLGPLAVLGIPIVAYFLIKKPRLTKRRIATLGAIFAAISFCVLSPMVIPVMLITVVYYLKKKPRLTKRRIATLGAIFAAIALSPLAGKLYVVGYMFAPAMLTVFFPVLAFLPISAVLLLTFVGLGAIAIWAFYKRDLRRVLLLCSVLALPTFAAAISMMFFPTFAGIFTFALLLPILVVLLSVFAGLGAIVVWAPLRKDLGRVLKLIKFTFGAIVLSSALWVALCASSFLWVSYQSLLPWLASLRLPLRILTFLIPGLIVAYLYWPGKKRGLFFGVLGPVLALELALLLTINLIIF